MPLVPTLLANDLEAGWLAEENGPHPGSVAESANAFAGIVSDWYANALAAGFPASTAQARRPQLLGTAVPALQAQNPIAAGQQLSVALMGYMAGQAFGTGIAAPPIATTAAGSMIGSAFSALDMPRPAKANVIASAVHIMAISGIVTFPHPPFSAPVT